MAPGHAQRTYGWPAATGEFLDLVEARIRAHASGIRDLAAAGDQASGRLLSQGQIPSTLAAILPVR